MRWFTGSSRERLPFIHDSFPVHSRAVHRGPKGTSKPADGLTSSSSSNHDCDWALPDSTNTLKLPALGADFVQPAKSYNSVKTDVDTQHSRCPPLDGYIRRYKACARLKGLSPTCANCHTRGKHQHFPVWDAQQQLQDPSDTSHLPFDSSRQKDFDPKTAPDSLSVRQTDALLDVDPSRRHRSSSTDAARHVEDGRSSRASRVEAEDPASAAADVSKADHLPELQLKKENGPAPTWDRIVDGLPLPTATDRDLLERRVEAALRKDRGQDGALNRSRHSGTSLAPVADKSGSGAAGEREGQRGPGKRRRARPLGKGVSPRYLQQLLERDEGNTILRIYSE